MFTFLLLMAVLILFAMLLDTRGRLKRAEATLEEAARRVGAIQRQLGLLPPKPGETFAEPVAAPPAPPAPVETVQPRFDQRIMDEAALRERWGPKNDAQSEEAAASADRDIAGETKGEPLRAAAFKAPPVPEVVGPEVVGPEALAPEALADVPSETPEDVTAESAAEPQPAITAHIEAGAAPVSPDDAPETGADVSDVIDGTMDAGTPPPASPLPPAPPPPPPLPPPSMASRFENLFGKTLPIWAGGITLAIAGVLIVRYAIDAGFFARIFTRGVQVVAGGIFGLGLIGGAEFAWRNEHRVRDTRVPQALSGAGIATLYAAVLVAANAYQLISPLAAFILLAAITAAALGLSLRFGAPSALLGLAGGLAAPALVGSVEPNVPLLAVYLGLTITGLTGVARMRRWPWLAVAALAGGAGWSLWMVAAGNALDMLGTLSVGGFVLLLAIALPLLSLDGPRSWLLRTASAIIGALQLALLVALGGFAPLEWGLFALLALAGQWLAWRDPNFSIVPTISAALSVLLLAVWPDPSLFWFATIALSLAAIHALPLLARLTSVQRALELCGIALAAPLLTRWHYPDIADPALALVALGGATLAAAGVARLWRVDDRAADTRLVWLASVSAGLVALALSLIVPIWAIPLAIGATAAAYLLFGSFAEDHRIEPVAVGFVGAAVLSLIASPLMLAEILHLLMGIKSTIAIESLARFGGLAALLLFFGVRAGSARVRVPSLALAGAFAYAMLAQMVPGWSLPLAMGGVALSYFAFGQWRPAVQLELMASGFAAAATLLLTATGPQTAAEWSRLVSSDLAVDFTAGLRWGGLTALFALFAARAAAPVLRLLAHLAAGALSYGLLAQFVPGWSLPLALVGVTIMLLAVGERERTFGVSALTVVFAAVFVPLLVVSADNAASEWTRLWGSDAVVPITSLIRWGGVAALALVFAVRARSDILQRAAQMAAALLTYGALAQIIPAMWLPLVPAIGAAVTLLAVPKVQAERIVYASGVFAALAAAWAIQPLMMWAAAALPSLAGIPMSVDHPALGMREIMLRLLFPALLVGGALWLRRALMHPLVVKLALGTAGLLAGVAVHALYRHGFAGVVGSDFVHFGLAQRLLWEALLIGGGVYATRRGHMALARPLLWAGTAHLFWYSLILHNPLWAAQAVGAIPALNLIAPLFLLAWIGLRESVRSLPAIIPGIERGVELVTMTLVAGFAWASLRQAFHGTLLVDAGTSSAENILRSILILSLAVAFLLWGIAKRRHDWRIASLALMLAAVVKVFLFDASGLEGLLRISAFVALGFSLIGIGWLYSRQLQRDEAPLPAEPESSAGGSP